MRSIPYLIDSAALVALLGYTAWRFIQAHRLRPRFEASEVVYEERHASGCSQKNILTKLGGAGNCLRLVVTESFLWVTTRFPFSLISPLYDLDHVIPLRSIVDVRRSSFLGKSFLLTYRDASDGEHTLRLRPRNPHDFIVSLGMKLDDASSA